MNVGKKRTYILAGIIVVLFCLFQLAGFIIERRRSNTEIAEAQLIVDDLTATVGRLDETVRLARIENGRLAAIYEQDKETIGKLEQTNRELEDTNKETARLIDEQGQIIKELSGINRGIRDSGSTIENGLKRAIEEIEKLIADIQARED